MPDDLLFWASNLSANSCREAEAHRAKATTGEERAWNIARDMLRGPHLVLSNLCGDDAVVLIEHIREKVERAFGRDRAILCGNAWAVEGVVIAPFVDLRHPFSRDGFEITILLDELLHARQNNLGIAHYRDLRQAILADLCRIDIDMDDLRIGREINELAVTRSEKREPMAMSRSAFCTA